MVRLKVTGIQFTSIPRIVFNQYVVRLSYFKFKNQSRGIKARSGKVKKGEGSRAVITSSHRILIMDQAVKTASVKR